MDDYNALQEGYEMGRKSVRNDHAKLIRRAIWVIGIPLWTWTLSEILLAWNVFHWYGC